MSLGKLTDAELEAMPEKQKRNLREQPAVLALYREHPFMEAYAKHTDMRIAQNGPMAAVGSGDNWDTHGDLQRDFLIKRGLKPGDRLLDIGCGTGRLARKVVPYMRNGYIGVDLSHDAIRACAQLAETEGWIEWCPTFIHGEVPTDGERVDFAWAYSVVNHLPLEEVAVIMERVSDKLRTLDSEFLFTFSNEPVAVRSGLKQFRHTRAQLHTAAESAGLAFKEVENWVQSAGYEPGRWSGGLRIGCARRRL